MRIRRRFPTVPSSISSSKESPPQKEEMEVSSFPELNKGRAREDRVETDWEVIKANAHRLLGGTSYTSKNAVRYPVHEEHSSTNPVSNGETGVDIQPAKGQTQMSLLEQGIPSQTMVAEQGSGSARGQISDLFSNAQMRQSSSVTTLSDAKWMTVPSASSLEGDAKVISGKGKEKAETTMTAGANTNAGSKKSDSLKPRGSSERICAVCGCGMKNKGKGKEDGKQLSGLKMKKKTKTRSLASLYKDKKAPMP